MDPSHYDGIDDVSPEIKGVAAFEMELERRLDDAHAAYHLEVTKFRAQ